ncbi:MAG TPA: methyl-accepting chemotaxis protein, partial [Burkholderiaceae bacterium]|nr:methyl-accepting chemotaxis protein [Burkholderiaceae bacterium]
MKARLTLAFGCLAALTAVIAAFAILSLASASGRFADFVEGVNARAAVAAQLRNAVDARAIAARNLVLVSRAEDLQTETAKVTRAHEDVQTLVRKLKEMTDQGAGVTERARQMFATLESVEQRYGGVAQAIVKLAIDKQRDEAIARMNAECRPLLAELTRASDEYARYTAERAADTVREARQAYESRRLVMIGVCLAGVLLAIVAGALIVRNLIRALGAEPADLGRAAQNVADGNLQRLPGADRAPAGSVLASLGAMQGKLATIVGQVRSASNSIATGSTQIATGNADLSQRTELQASNLQQTASSMEQFSSTVKNNAETARQANQLATAASEAATRGGQVVGQVVATMSEISDASRKISDIIGVIDGIAFQTNILAL